jgi:hypothetical protein
MLNVESAILGNLHAVPLQLADLDQQANLN